ncbi:hypothetical protein [Lysobacter antibioticus]|uniref:hypothetical protein n=1 Tax=Lysobacter antibioticus TaxID=84531 RepID=UPI00118732A7|nr:hypothetical protein [Lysobacter antibioticus]
MLLFELQARTFGADAGIFHTGHPCPDEKRRASLRAALRVFYCLRECSATHSNGNDNDNDNDNDKILSVAALG